MKYIRNIKDYNITKEYLLAASMAEVHSANLE